MITDIAPHTAMKTILPLALVVATLWGATHATTHGAEAATVPQGFLQIQIAGGAVTSRINTMFSVPLLRQSSAGGQLSGKLTGVGTNTLTNANAGWTLGQLSVAATPHILRITSGTALGRTFLISTSTPNTATTLTLDNADLGGATLADIGVVSGDSYAIFPCETLLSLLGTPGTTGVLGGASAQSADFVQIIVNGAWQTYFFHTTNNRWARNSIGNPDASNFPIRPDSAILYGRLASAPISIPLTGSVPHINRKSLISNTGSTLTASGWPTNLTLQSASINSLPGWVSTTIFSDSDTVSLYINGSWRTYWFDGTNWRRNTIGNPISDTQLISAATGVLVQRKGTAPGSTALVQNIPYNINP
jgi:hypothetical protein